MASHAHIPSSPSPSPNLADHNFDEARTGTDAVRRNWIGGLPGDIWLCILDRLCPHSHPGPALKPGAEFTGSHDLNNVMPAPLSPKSRRDLLAMTRTCRQFRDLGQIYISRRFDSPVQQTISLFQRTMRERPDLAKGVREVSLSSDADNRRTLEYLGNIRTLNYCIRHREPLQEDVKFGDDTNEDQFPKLRNLKIFPSTRHLVDLPRGRLWLESLLQVATKVRSLSCYHFVDGYLHEDDQRPLRQYCLQKRDSPNYAGLPGNEVTRLDLRGTWFRFYSLEQLLLNFKHLREFKLSGTAKAGFELIDDDKMVRPVDGQDVVTLLEPLKQQLEVLELDFRGYPESISNLGAFRPIVSLAAFTTLKTLRLSEASMEPPKFNNEILQRFIGRTKDFLVNLLPCRSLEFLQIDGMTHHLDYPVLELARRTSLGEFPKLKHVRLRGTASFDVRKREHEKHYPGRYHELARFVPEKYRERTVVLQGSFDPFLEREARPMFEKAGVLFERLSLSWRVLATEDSEGHGGLMEVYPQPCAARGCKNFKCIALHQQVLPRLK